MAPEQVHGRPLDGRSDLWALGVVLYEMLTGTRPFAGEHEIAVAHAIVHDEPARASALRRDIPAELDDLLHMLLRKDPEERHQSADEVAAALAAMRLDENPWVARPRQVLRSWRRRVSRHGAVLVPAALAAAVSGGWLANRTLAAPDGPVAVAVLPFEETGEDEESRHLAIALADDIRTELARLHGLTVPGYVTSTYNDPAVKPLDRIAADLQVGALLTGSVQRVGDRLRVETRLLDAGSGEVIWTRQDERPAGELWQVRREATRETVEALRIRLSAGERARLARAPTSEGRSYEAYLRGRAVELTGIPRDFFQPRPVENVRQAQSFYTQARDLDPGFAVARARLAVMHTVSSAMYDTSEARREQARLEAETALRSDPGLAEAHEALAEYRDRRGELDQAIVETRLAIQMSPNSAALRLALGNRYARAGRLEDAVAEFDEAMRLEPGSPNAAFMAAIYYLRLRRDEAAMQAMDRAIALAPDYHMIRVIKGHTWLRWKGVPDTLEAAMRRIPLEWDPDGMATWARYTALWPQRRDAEALAMLDRSGSELSRDGLVYQPMPLMRARLYDWMGDRARARASYTAARGLLQDSVAAHPDDSSIRIALGMAYAGLGQREEAVREARRAMELTPVARNTVAAMAFMGGAVEVFGRAGEIDGALELLELLFSMPAGREATVAYLRVWPGFAPLREDPRFDELLARFPGR
jgi:serine/threonine-protein kinase